MGVDSHTNYALRKNGKQEINPVHRELAEPLAEILEPTYGLIVYQEQILAVAQKVAGYTLGQADLLRKAMGKKKKEILDAEYGPFSEGMSANGYSASAIKALWDTLVPFSDYAFNKAHTAAYGLISYWTAYLKQHYAPEYMAALLTSVRDDKDKSGIYLNECRRMKIQVLPPDVNESSANFTPVGNDIRFGLTAIRNVGHNVVDGIVAARAEKGRYLDFNDFLEKVPALVCNKRVVESLIKAGAFDDMKHRRRALVAIHEQAVDQYVDVKRNEAIGQDSLFGGIDDTERLRRHRHDPRRHRGVGQDHPPRPRARHARPLRLRPPAARPRARALPGHRLHHRPADARRGAAARHRRSPSAAWSTSVQRKITKRGDSWATITLEDLDGAIEVLLFPSTYQLASTLLVEDSILAHQGRPLARQGPARAARPGGHRPRPVGRAQRAGRDQPPVDPLHAADGGPAARRARHPPWGHRGPAATLVA